MDKDPCKCTEHECKQMLLSNQALRMSVKGLLDRVRELRVQNEALLQSQTVGVPVSSEESS